MAFPWLSFIVLSPVVAALLLLFVPDRARMLTRLVALAGATFSLLGTLYVAYAYDREAMGFQFVESYSLVPDLGIGIDLAADGWSVVLLLLTGIIIFAGVWVTWTLENRTREFFIFLLVLVGGVYGVFVSQDLFIFFLFYEVAVLPMYLLIGIWGSSDPVEAQGPFKRAMSMLDVGGKEYAAMKLTLMLLAGSALILAAMLGMYWEVGGSFSMAKMADHEFSSTLQLLAFPALWIGFGSLAGLWPFHTWSPDGHASAPTAVSMLHAGVLMKLGAFGVMRVGMVLLPEGARDWVWVMGTVAVINIVYGALSAMSQKDLKYIIAYSSVSHMGVVMLGAATITVNGWNGAVYQMFAHGIMTGLFFALVGIVYERAHSRWVPSMGGFSTVMPLTAALFTLAGLSSLGMPGTAGFVAEFLVFVGAWQSASPWWAVFGLIGAVLTAVYVLRAARTIFLGPGPNESFEDLKPTHGTERVGLWILGLALVLFGVWPNLLLYFIDGTTMEYISVFLQASESATAMGGTP